MRIPICSGHFAAVAEIWGSNGAYIQAASDRHAVWRTDLYELSETADVMKWYRDLIPAAPDDLEWLFCFLTVPPVAPFPEHCT